MHVAVSVAEAVWSGNPKQVAIRPSPPGYILGLHVAPGATNPGPIGLDLVRQSRKIASGINDAVVDRAYSNKRESFVRPLHKMGVNVTMDYTTTEINNPKPIRVGRNEEQQLLNSTGTLFPPWLPEYRQIPPEDSTPEKLTKWYTDRALWRWTRNRKLAGGGGQFFCSQCAGRVTTTAKTHNPEATPSNTAPHIPIEDKYCCGGMVSIGVEMLDAFQEITYGTPAHDKSYGRRNPSEKTFSMIKDKGGLKLGWCRSFGLAAHTIGALALTIATTSSKPSASKEPKPKSPPVRPGPRTSNRPVGTSSRTASLPGHRRTRRTAAPAAPTVTPTVGFAAPG